MKITDLDIDIIYQSAEGWTASMHAINSGTDTISDADTGLNGMWNMQGGLEITVNGHWTIFHSLQFHHLLQVTGFLLSGVCMIKGTKVDEELRFFNLPENSAIYLPLYDRQQSVLTLQLADDDVILFWQAQKPELRSTRYDRTFRDIRIPRSLWLSAALLSLRDFFHIYELHYNECEKPERMHTNYLKLWTSLRTLS